MITDTDEAFEIFWTAGMRKVNKKKAKSLFTRIAKDNQPPEMFALFLRGDIKNRLAVSQFGFAAMHPTTYLNGERWEDDLPTPNHNAIACASTEAERTPISTRDRSLTDDLTDRSWAQ